jgi:hypothetical protein
VRALTVQNRLSILSRPTVTTLDNQTALVNFGQNVPLVGSTTITATGLATQSISRTAVGIVMQVTPKIYPDGTVLMRIIPEVSAVDPTPLNLGNGSLGTVLDIQHVETTISCQDGETIVLGGLMSKQDSKNETKIPILGDLPGVGSLFRYRTHNKLQKEILFIMTPRIIRNPGDAARLLAEEQAKTHPDWKDVARFQGPGAATPLINGLASPGPLNGFINPLDGNCASPTVPPVMTPKFEEGPAPQAVPQNIPPGPTSQLAPRQQPVIVNQTTANYNPAVSPAGQAPQSFPVNSQYAAVNNAPLSGQAYAGQAYTGQPERRTVYTPLNQGAVNQGAPANNQPAATPQYAGVQQYGAQQFGAQQVGGQQVFVQQGQFGTPATAGPPLQQVAPGMVYQQQP